MLVLTYKIIKNRKKMKRSIKAWYALDIPEQEGIRKKYIVLKY